MTGGIAGCADWRDCAVVVRIDRMADGFSLPASAVWFIMKSLWDGFVKSARRPLLCDLVSELAPSAARLWGRALKSERASHEL
jgi:hypothetical protein